MVLDFTDSKNSCYLRNLRSDDSEVALARTISGIPQVDVDRIISNTSKFFRNLAHKVGLNIVGSGPSETAICCSMGANIKDLLCQNAQMQLMQFVKVEGAYIIAKLVWFDEMSSGCISPSANFMEVKSKREQFMSLFNNSWTSLVKVVLGDGDKGVQFYRKTPSGTLIPESVLASPHNETQVPHKAHGEVYCQPTISTPNGRFNALFAPPSRPSGTHFSGATVECRDRPLKRRRQAQQLHVHYPNTATKQMSHRMHAFVTQSRPSSHSQSYEPKAWRENLTRGIIA